jgi:ethanolamine utilization protein EutN
MLLGRVVGTLVACIVYEGLEGVPMLIVQPLDKTGQPEGRTLVAADATRMAGPGEFVYYEGGREAALALDRTFVPVDHAIIGIVDALHREDR